MTNTTIDEQEAAELATVAANSATALQTALRRAHLHSLAIDLGFEPGPALQLAALAAETERTTGLPAEQFLETTTRAIATESATAHDIARLGGGYLNPFHIACTWAWNACRHAGKFARAVLLRR